MKVDAIGTLTNFMNAWKDSNWSEMLENAQITWRSKERNKSIDLLKSWFYLKDLTTFKILKTEKISDTWCSRGFYIGKMMSQNRKLKELKNKFETREK